MEMEPPTAAQAAAASIQALAEMYKLTTCLPPLLTACSFPPSGRRTPSAGSTMLKPNLSSPPASGLRPNTSLYPSAAVADHSSSRPFFPPQLVPLPGTLCSRRAPSPASTFWNRNKPPTPRPAHSQLPQPPLSSSYCFYHYNFGDPAPGIQKTRYCPAGQLHIAVAVRGSAHPSQGQCNTHLLPCGHRCCYQPSTFQLSTLSYRSCNSYCQWFSYPILEFCS